MRTRAETVTTGQERAGAIAQIMVGIEAETGAETARKGQGKAGAIAEAAVGIAQKVWNRYVSKGLVGILCSVAFVLGCILLDCLIQCCSVVCSLTFPSV